MQISEQKILKDRNIYMENEYFDMSGNISQIIYMYYTKLNIITFNVCLILTIISWFSCNKALDFKSYDIWT